MKSKPERAYPLGGKYWGLDTDWPNPHTGYMTNHENLIANMTGLDIPAFLDELDDRLAQARDWNPVPYGWDVGHQNVIDELDDIAREDFLSSQEGMYASYNHQTGQWDTIY
jgi:hypothetical protein